MEVIFYDGFKKLIQPINLRPMPPELKNQVSYRFISALIQGCYINIILGVCLLISNLPGKALRTLVDIVRDNDVISDFCVDSASFKKCNFIMT